MVDFGRISDEQGIVDWEDDPSARVSDEQAVVDWSHSAAGRVSDVVVLVDWIRTPPPYDAKLLAEQAMVEWTPPSAGIVSSEVVFADWTPESQGILLDQLLFVEWEDGNTMTCESGRIELTGSDAATSYGLDHRELADFALAQVEKGGQRGTPGPGHGGDGDGFPLNGNPTPPGTLGIARYPAPHSDPTWEAS